MPVLKQNPRVKVRVSRTINTAQYESLNIEAGVEMDLEEGETVEGKLLELRKLITVEVLARWEKAMRKAVLDGKL